MPPTVNSLMRELVDSMAADEVPSPLTQPLTLANVWDDLCALAGEPLPADVAALVDAPAPAVAIRAVPKARRR